MKKKLILMTLFLTLQLVSNAQKDPVIMKIDDISVKKSEFLQIYLKNNPDPKFDKASLDEYMELFQNLNLK